MESVAIVLSCEEEFGITIPDAAAEKMLTPRDVIDFVIQERRRGAHLDTAAHVRGALSALGCSSFDLEVRFDELFRRRGVAAEWKKLSQNLAPFAVPPARPGGVPVATTAFAFVLGVLCLLFQQWQLAVIFALGTLAGRGWMRSSMSVPQEVATPRKLITRLTRPVSDEEVSAKVREIVSQELCLKEGVYDERKRFVEDLGLS